MKWKRFDGRPVVVPPNPFAEGDTILLARTDASIDEEEAQNSRLSAEGRHLQKS